MMIACVACGTKFVHVIVKFKKIFTTLRLFSSVFECNEGSICKIKFAGNFLM